MRYTGIRGGMPRYERYVWGTLQRDDNRIYVTLRRLRCMVILSLMPLWNVAITARRSDSTHTWKSETLWWLSRQASTFLPMAADLFTR